MDIGAFGNAKGKDKGGKGPKGGKPQNHQKPNVVCHNCGKPGHYKADCWAPGGGKANAPAKATPNNAPKETGKGKGSEGGKSKGKGKGSKGKPKAMGNVEESKEPEGEEATGGWDASWEVGKVKTIGKSLGAKQKAQTKVTT